MTELGAETGGGAGTAARWSSGELWSTTGGYREPGRTRGARLEAGKLASNTTRLGAADDRELHPAPMADARARTRERESESEEWCPGAKTGCGNGFGGPVSD
ncbi:hypothetical protein PR202_ga11496 [Eleusine coracana subsp. coracana]|uniref:Uncharacterized protein n=1 Tax=Eleusine coracana subsp. coracana TaxID=191504 RepID=A0AAV5C9S0_ELECO|nr:hypothetical protein PR202_ga11496 [Eleusine coracana subsp. coracana]